MTDVYRAPMRSRRDDIDSQMSIGRALAEGLVGFGAAEADPRLARRLARFEEIDDGAFVWTRDGDGLYWLGRIDGAYFYDDNGAAVDLVHVRPCRWLPDPVVESDVPVAVIATFGRGGRNFQQTHAEFVESQTDRIWQHRSGGDRESLWSQANCKYS